MQRSELDSEEQTNKRLNAASDLIALVSACMWHAKREHGEDVTEFSNIEANDAVTHGFMLAEAVENRKLHHAVSAVLLLAVRHVRATEGIQAALERLIPKQEESHDVE